jgi:N,N'-diacetylbacillosaminyl-diphospho-undecaprenol alpha-1,3-N-acetylgalactosaminyltransferase
MKIALILQRDFPAWHLRRGLIETLISRGIEVIVISPDGPFVPRIEGLGARHIAVPMRRSMSPLHDLTAIWRLYRVIRVEKPDIVHTMNAKPNIYGTFAARAAGVRRVVGLVAGLGYGFMDDGTRKKKVVKRIYTLLYRCANSLSERVWFQNPDDLNLFVDKRLIGADKTLLIRGSGVNISEFSSEAVDSNHVQRLRSQLGIDETMKVVVMMARLTWSKGVKHFIEASQREWEPSVRFLLAGPLASEESDAVPEEYIRSSLSHYLVWAEGFRNDVREILSLADVVVAPCIYREGLPRVLLEALAMGKPIVASDQVGCREPCANGENGYLIPLADTTALANAVARIIDNSTRQQEFGARSREMAETEFDERIVVNRIITELYRLAPVDLPVPDARTDVVGLGQPCRSCTEIES